MFKAWRIHRRLKKAAKAWNFCNRLICHIITISSDPAHEQFVWCQLVWQEIDMWIRLDRQVTYDDFELICTRRGFDATKISFLKTMLVHVGIGYLLESSCDCKEYCTVR